MFKDKHLPVRKFSKVSFFLSLSFLNCGISSLCISLSFIILNISDREHSLLGEGSLYGMSPVLIVWIDLLHYVQETTYFLCWSSPVLLNWRPAVQWSFPQRWAFSLSDFKTLSFSLLPLRIRYRMGPTLVRTSFNPWVAVYSLLNWFGLLFHLKCLGTLNEFFRHFCNSWRVRFIINRVACNSKLSLGNIVMRQSETAWVTCHFILCYL